MEVADEGRREKNGSESKARQEGGGAKGPLPE